MLEIPAALAVDMGRGSQVVSVVQRTLHARQTAHAFSAGSTALGGAARMLKYTYDGFNRLKIVSDNSVDPVYTYDADGHRTSKTDSNGVEQYVWDGDELVVVYNTSAKEATSYIRGLNLIASRENNAPVYYHYNAHGDVVQLTDSTDAVVKDYTYGAFGVEQNADDTDANPFRYCGEQYDSETGNYYLRARYYTPGTGRFTQTDTHWNPGNMVYGDSGNIKLDFIMQASNLYLYCGNNPMHRYDPSGNSWITDGLADIGDFVSDEWDALNTMQKYAQRDFWKIGSKIPLRDERGYESAVCLLEHSLQDNPEDIYRDENSRIAGLISESSALNDLIDVSISNSVGTTQHFRFLEAQRFLLESCSTQLIKQMLPIRELSSVTEGMVLG